MVYPLIVALLMVILPVLSVIIERLMAPTGAALMTVIGQWFLFWSVGIRLFTAGLRQVVQPAFTARDIFGVTDRAAFVLVQELGFANVAMGVAGICSLVVESWRVPVALVSGLFYGLAGIKHGFNTPRALNENIALYSDLWICLILLGFVVYVLRA